MYRTDVVCDGARNVVSHGLCAEDVSSVLALSFSSAVLIVPLRSGLYLSTSMRSTASSMDSSPVQLGYDGGVGVEHFVCSFRASAHSCSLAVEAQRLGESVIGRNISLLIPPRHCNARNTLVSGARTRVPLPHVSMYAGFVRPLYSSDDVHYKCYEISPSPYSSPTLTAILNLNDTPTPPPAIPVPSTPPPWPLPTPALKLHTRLVHRRFRNSVHHSSRTRQG